MLCVLICVCTGINSSYIWVEIVTKKLKCKNLLSYVPVSQKSNVTNSVRCYCNAHGIGRNANLLEKPC